MRAFASLELPEPETLSYVYSLRYRGEASTDLSYLQACWAIAKWLCEAGAALVLNSNAIAWHTGQDVLSLNPHRAFEVKQHIAVIHETGRVRTESQSPESGLRVISPLQPRPGDTGTRDERREPSNTGISTFRQQEKCDFLTRAMPQTHQYTKSTSLGAIFFYLAPFAPSRQSVRRRSNRHFPNVQRFVGAKRKDNTPLSRARSLSGCLVVSAKLS